MVDLPDSPRIIVVGAGAFGGWTALHLLRRGADVTLVDTWGAGNSRSSSGGETRFIRAMYGADRIYSEMVRSSFAQFEQLERVTGSQLYRETGCLWMFDADDSYARRSLPILAELDFPVDSLDIEEAGERWPQISFSGVETVYFEHRAGVLSARESCQAVKNRFIDEGGVFEIAQADLEPRPGGGPVAVRTGDGSHLEADVFVFCCGPWLGRVFPELIGDAILPSRQEVYFFGPPAGNTMFDLGQLPGWFDFGEKLVYGFPRTHGRGLKFADDTRGTPFEPTFGDRTPTPEWIEKAREFIARRFPAMSDAPLVEARVCQYENSPDGELIIDRHPEAENCWIAGGGSGHGFKLGPAVGEYVAETILEGKEVEPRFRLDRLDQIVQTKTQFD